LAVSTPLTEFPIPSRRGDQTEIPITFGTTIKTQPPTPDFAGIPTSKAHYPEKSYIPQVSIRGSAHLTCSGSQRRCPVRGFIPPLARVDAMIDIIFEVERIEQI
jgi:hypothetical protein